MNIRLKKKTLTLLSVAENILTEHNSHTFSNFNHRTSTTLTPTPSATSITEPQQLSHLQQLQSHNLSQQLSQKLINSHTYLAAKHCSSHSHTISVVHLHIIMSGNGLLTL